MVRVAVVGYGFIGQRPADGVALQKDMELVGVADVAPTISVRALKDKGMPYAIYCAAPGHEKVLTDAGIPVSSTTEALIDKVDIVLDATSAVIGAKNKELYKKKKKKSSLSGWRKKRDRGCVFSRLCKLRKGSR